MEPGTSHLHREMAEAIFRESAGLKLAFLEGHLDLVARAAIAIAGALRAGRKVLIFGNGGSAADAQHFAGELVNRFLLDRPALPARRLERGQPDDVQPAAASAGPSDRVVASRAAPGGPAESSGKTAPACAPPAGPISPSASAGCRTSTATAPAMTS